VDSGEGGGFDGDGVQNGSEPLVYKGTFDAPGIHFVGATVPKMWYDPRGYPRNLANGLFGTTITIANKEGNTRTIVLSSNGRITIN
jgi:hypothetical protein